MWNRNFFVVVCGMRCTIRARVVEDVTLVRSLAIRAGVVALISV
jgi:heterodisulfide reductase subunit C